MKRKVTFILFCLIITIINAQQKEYFELKKTIPQEKIFVHLNSSFFITGEPILYKVYCNDLDNKPSEISKVVYVELVNNERKVMFKHKIKLESSKGYGDFFINSKIKSGNYKLVAYTQWMRNDLEKHIFQSDIFIINPFEVDKGFIENNISRDSIVIDTGLNYTTKTHKNNAIEIQTDKKNYTARKKVTLRLKTNTNNLGNYSISVRKKEINPIFNTSSSSTHTNQKVDTLFLPDLRGELITGRVINPSNNMPVENCLVSYTVSGNNFIFELSTTNKNGNFFFNINNANDKNEGVFKILGDKTKQNYKLIVNKNESPNYSFLKFPNTQIQPTIKDYILDRSIKNQIENSYYHVKKDSTLKNNRILPFYHTKTKKYLLDDFNRFKTVRETIIEIINEVFVRKESDGNYSFHIRYNTDQTDASVFRADLPIILILDGNIIEDHNELFYYNPKKIKSILVVKDKYFLNKNLYGGIIAVETFKGDYQEKITNNDSSKKIQLLNFFAKKRYYQPDYENDDLSHTPDYRHQLYWNPNVNISKPETLITFYTSDNTGDFEVVLEGYNKNGDFISLKDDFVVE